MQKRNKIEKLFAIFSVRALMRLKTTKKLKYWCFRAKIIDSKTHKPQLLPLQK